MRREMSQEIFQLADELGPELIIHISDVKNDLKAIVVVHNSAAGPTIGGIRMSQDIGVDEVYRLAHGMTLKNAMAWLPHGGGKAGIIADPTSPNKERIIRAFAQKIRHILEYIPGPDMGTSEIEMAYIKNEINRAVGLPRELGGIPLDQIGCTGYGVAKCTIIAAQHINLELNGARLAVEGFGSVGKNAARFLAKKGVVLIAASDSKGTIYNPDGLDINELIRVKNATGSVNNYENGEKLLTTDLFNISTDIFIPAARPDVITQSNADTLDTKLIVEGANIPTTPAAEKLLHERGVLCIPDFIANVGGVITGSVEYHGGTEKQASKRIVETVEVNTRQLLDAVMKQNISPREIAESIAKHRVQKAMKYRK
jgi:glutamate dehydrogenase (NAD(P)+)